MSYFEHPFLSNSDFKGFKKRIGMGVGEDPVNLQAIFDFGEIFHKVILEPNKITEADMANKDYELAKKMGKTFFTDPSNRMIILRSDFEREREFYNPRVEISGMWFKGRCKADGYCKGIALVMELKGLAVDSRKAFESALLRLDYDQAAAHYLLVSEATMIPIVGISKKKPELMFKRICKKHDEFYLGGEQKMIDTLHILRNYSPSDVQLIAA